MVWMYGLMVWMLDSIGTSGTVSRRAGSGFTAARRSSATNKLRCREIIFVI
jgi:hypothetical protein